MVGLFNNFLHPTYWENAHAFCSSNNKTHSRVLPYILSISTMCPMCLNFNTQLALRILNKIWLVLETPGKKGTYTLWRSNDWYCEKSNLETWSKNRKHVQNCIVHLELSQNGVISPTTCCLPSQEVHLCVCMCENASISALCRQGTAPKYPSTKKLSWTVWNWKCHLLQQLQSSCSVADHFALFEGSSSKN